MQLIIQYGVIPYYSSFAMIMPDLNLGVFFSANAYSHVTVMQILMRIISVVINEPEIKLLPQDYAGVPLKKPVYLFTGVYENDLYGEVVVKTDFFSDLIMEYGQLEGSYQLLLQNDDVMIAVGTTIPIRLLGDIQVQFKRKSPTQKMQTLIWDDEITFTRKLIPQVHVDSDLHRALSSGVNQIQMQCFVLIIQIVVVLGNCY